MSTGSTNLSSPTCADRQAEDRARRGNYLKTRAVADRGPGHYQTDRAKRSASADAERAASALLRRDATRAGDIGPVAGQQGVLTEPSSASGSREVADTPLRSV